VGHGRAVVGLSYRRSALVALLLVLVSLVDGPSMSARSAQERPFRVPIDVVPVSVTVTDEGNRLIQDLTQSEFKVYDDGVPRPIVTFASAARPLDVVLMLDVSGSMYPNLRLLREAVEEFFRGLRPDDRVLFGTFGGHIAISEEFTGDVNQLRGRVPSAIDRRSLTPLWRALDDAITALDAAKNRPVIVVFSDGKDSGQDPGQRKVTLDDVIGRARLQGTMIYAIGLHSRGGVAASPLSTTITAFDDRPDPGLGTLAAETGGRYFEVDLNPERDLGAAFARALDELHNQYLLGFEAARDGRLHQVMVTVARPGATARARSAYQAPAP
jgi:VWFA-related protein